MNRYSICQAYAQLEADYNVGGWVRERPSNQRRKESIGVQLHRIGYDSPNTWVDIEAEVIDPEDTDAAEVREVYMRAVIRWKLPIDETLHAAMVRHGVL